MKAGLLHKNVASTGLDHIHVYSGQRSENLKQHLERSAEERLVWRYQNREDSCIHRFGFSRIQKDHRE